ncbi:MAG: hypothetical protein H6739_29340 [Alphaproteobacteria bacterium]|nr:hypothetical protein [Alphaproteobacteria bacterium]
MNDTDAAEKTTHMTTEMVVRGILAPYRCAVTTAIAASIDGRADYYLWDGDVWDAERKDSVPGRFWIPALFGGARVAQGLLKMMRAKKITQDEAQERMARWHTGLGKDQVSAFLSAYAEIDHLSAAEQMDRYRALSAATGLQWGVWVSSGGKSVHGYLLYDQLVAADDPVRDEIQRLMIVCLEGDTHITDKSRLMRLPGYAGAERPQPVLHYDPDARYPAEVIRDRLRAYAAELGIGDIETAIDALKLAERLDNAALKDGGEARAEMRAHAALLRRTRGSPASQDMELARAMLRGGDIAIARQGAARGDIVADGITPGGYRKARVDMAKDPRFSPLLPLFSGLGAGGQMAVPCPLHNHSHKGGRPGTIWVHANGARGFNCNGRGEAYVDVPGVPGVPGARAEPMPERETTILSEIVDSLEPGGFPDGDDADQGPMVEVDDHVEQLQEVYWAPAHGWGLLQDVEGFDSEILGLRTNAEYGEKCVLQSLCSNRETTARKKPDNDGETGNTSDLKIDRVDNAEREADERLRDLGSGTVHCIRGPHHHVAKKGGKEATSSRLACMSYRCPTCGPRQQHVLQASARVIVRRYLEDHPGEWTARRIEIPTRLLPRAAQDALARWQRKSPEDRLYVGIGTTPETCSYIVMWRGAEHVPQGALHRHLLHLGAVEEGGALPDAAERMVAAAELDAWTEGKRRATILRGSPEIKAAIAELRDRVLGRSRARKQGDNPVDEKTSIRSYDSAAEVRAEAEKRAHADTRTVDEGPDGRSGGYSVRWAFLDGETPPAAVLASMESDGFFRLATGRRRKPWTGGIPVIWIVPPIEEEDVA